jgi:hypothetical protein
MTAFHVRKVVLCGPGKPEDHRCDAANRAAIGDD